MEDIIKRSVKESFKAKEHSFNPRSIALLIESARTIADAFKSGGKLMIAGNGGSAADAQHMAAEFVNRFQIERPPLPAIALSTNTSNLTAIGNDYSYDQVFSKQVRALGRENDVFLGITTSGKSGNVINAVEIARNMGIKTIGLTGNGGGQLVGKCDILLVAESKCTPRIQEVHLMMYHVICELVDHMLFKSSDTTVRNELAGQA